MMFHRIIKWVRKGHRLRDVVFLVFLMRLIVEKKLDFNDDMLCWFYPRYGLIWRLEIRGMRVTVKV